MSSVNVRNAILQFIDDNSGEDVVDLTGAFEDLSQELSDAGIQPNAPWLGIEFIGSDEIPIGLAADNDKGTYRETGSIYLHVCEEAKIGSSTMLTRGETLRDLFRGRRIGSILIEGVTPLNTGRGATLDFESGYMSASFLLAYHYDFSL